MFLFYRWRNWSSERLWNVFKFIQLIRVLKTSVKKDWLGASPTVLSTALQEIWLKVRISFPFPHQLLSLLTLMRRLKTKVFSLDLLTPGTVKHGREMIFFSLGGTKWKSSWWARAPEPFPYLTTRMMPDSYSVKRGAWRILLWKNLSTQEERPTNTDWWEFPNTKVRACLLDREAHTAAKLFHSQRLTC